MVELFLESFEEDVSGHVSSHFAGDLQYQPLPHHPPLSISYLILLLYNNLSLPIILPLLQMLIPLIPLLLLQSDSQFHSFFCVVITGVYEDIAAGLLAAAVTADGGGVFFHEIVEEDAGVVVGGEHCVGGGDSFLLPLPNNFIYKKPYQITTETLLTYNLRTLILRLPLILL